MWRPLMRKIKITNNRSFYVPHAFMFHVSIILGSLALKRFAFKSGLSCVLLTDFNVTFILKMLNNSRIQIMIHFQKRIWYYFDFIFCLEIACIEGLNIWVISEQRKAKKKGTHHYKRRRYTKMKHVIFFHNLFNVPTVCSICPRKYKQHSFLSLCF